MSATFSFVPPHSPSQRSPGEPAVDLAPLREMGDEDLVVELALLFMESTTGLIATIRDAMARADAHAVSRGAHSVKGAAANLYAERLRVAAGSLEEAGKRNDLSQMLVLVEAVVTEFEEAAAYLRKELALASPPAP